MKQLQGKFNKDCTIFIDDVEESAMETIQSILDDEVSKDVPIRIMPDCHAGVDIVIGFTMPLTDRINPSHVGVDIGCGVLCVKIVKPECSLELIDEAIRRVIPMGFNRNNNGHIYIGEKAIELCNKLGLDVEDVNNQLGTLGGGNHFVEVGEFNNDWYLFIHTGSRNFGLQVCNYHVNKAKSNNSKYLFGADMEEYLLDMDIAQQFSNLNRRLIAFRIVEELSTVIDKKVCDTIHNYIDTENKIIRKGAVSSTKGELLVIPMNMRDGVLLCVGKGNSNWNKSAPHGAGRVLARNKAKKTLSLDTFKEQMKNVYSTSVCIETIDEAPDAYKDMNIIMDAIQDTVDIIGVIKPILNIKAKE